MNDSPAAPASAASPPPATPRQFGRYVVLRELKRDRTSATYLATDRVMHRDVLIKSVQFPPPTIGQGELTAETSPLEKAFVRQAQAAGRLHHPHIVTVFEAGRVRDIGYLAIERVNGRPLHELLASGWRPEFVHCASICARVADAIEYAHSQGIAHGHLGPQHVIMQPDGAPRVEGFGGWIDGGTSGHDALAGTDRLLPYFQNELTDEGRNRDVVAAGALLFMLLTGRAPNIAAAGENSVPSVMRLRPDTPPELARIVDELLASAGRVRKRSAADLRDRLTSFIWNARKDNIAPGTIGIPLGPPPRAEGAPEPAATIAEPATANGITRVPALSDSMIQRTAPIEPQQPVWLAPNTAPPPTTSAPRPAPSRGALDWLARNSIQLAGGVALIALGLIIGLLLGQGSRPGKATATAVATAPAETRKAGSGIVKLDVSPWGELVVNGKLMGVSPPLAELTLEPGKYTIEIRHAGKTPVVANVVVDPTTPQLLRHRFQ
jgi:eukaryotic-like serine/threonine-protein kinase